MDHLIESLLLCNGTHILVRPCVARNLMTFSDHALKNGRPSGRSIVDRTLAQVVASDEERSFRVFLFEQIKHIVGVDVRTVIESDSDSARLNARVNTLAAILNIAKLRTRNVSCAIAVGDLVCVATRAEVHQAVRRRAVLLGISTPTL